MPARELDRFTPSPSPSRSNPDDLDRLRRDGYVVIDDGLEPRLASSLRGSFLAALADKVARFGLRPAEVEAPDSPPHQRVLNDFKPRGGNHDHNRWNMHLPSRMPFLHPDLLANPRVLALVHSLVGRDAVAYLIASDTPYPGATHQNIHQDFSRFSLALNVPLVDCTEENAPIEVWPGTHRPDPSDAGESFSTEPYAISAGSMIELSRAIPSRRLLLPAGSMLLRDHRLMHRGTANRSSAPRPMLSIYYMAPRAVPPRWMADAGAWAAKRLRVVGRGRGEDIQRPSIFSLGNVLGRIVEECSLSDRDHRRRIPRSVWSDLPAEVRELLRFAAIEGGHERSAERPSAAGAARLIRECWLNGRASLTSSLRGTPRRPDEEPGAHRPSSRRGGSDEAA